MKTLTINVTNVSDYQLLLQLAKRLGINVESHSLAHEEKTVSKKHDIFTSAGMWRDYDIDSDELRRKAWQ